MGAPVTVMKMAYRKWAAYPSNCIVLTVPAFDAACRIARVPQQRAVTIVSAGNS